jgi:hypothetical protein
VGDDQQRAEATDVFVKPAELARDLVDVADDPASA